ncbi:MAG TPA: hypothetical protein VFL91_08280 [Thermomicrobiales bacterium]|nr:hypothetical protein [Thermomicrobiales bacterium]
MRKPSTPDERREMHLAARVRGAADLAHRRRRNALRRECRRQARADPIIPRRHRGLWAQWTFLCALRPDLSPDPSVHLPAGVRYRGPRPVPSGNRGCNVGGSGLAPLHDGRLAWRGHRPNGWKRAHKIDPRVHPDRDRFLRRRRLAAHDPARPTTAINLAAMRALQARFARLRGR